MGRVARCTSRLPNGAVLVRMHQSQWRKSFILHFRIGRIINPDIRRANLGKIGHQQDDLPRRTRVPLALQIDNKQCARMTTSLITGLSTFQLQEDGLVSFVIADQCIGAYFCFLLLFNAKHTWERPGCRNKMPWIISQRQKHRKFACKPIATKPAKDKIKFCRTIAISRWWLLTRAPKPCLCVISFPQRMCRNFLPNKIIARGNLWMDICQVLFFTIAL